MNTFVGEKALPVPRFFAAALALVVLMASAAPIRAQDYQPNVPTLSPEDIEPGMKGYGLSVFAGGEPERFDVEVKGIIHNEQAAADMIVLEASHPIIEGHGVIAGMSGSPIFVEHEGEDKLIGALAYGWQFSVRGICGVTPIHQMLDVYQLVTEEAKIPRSARAPSVKGWPEAREALARSQGLKAEAVEIPADRLRSMGVQDIEGDTVAMKPLGAPLLVNTQSAEAMKVLRQAFDGTLLRPVMAGGQGGSREPEEGDSNINGPVNGGALSVVMAEGDLQMMGLGTVTYVDGDRFVAFGHPMFAMGDVDLPVAVSEVVAVVPSLAMPFKLGNALQKVGALRQDRWFAIGGTTSAESDLVPLRIHLVTEETGFEKTFNFRLWQHRDYFGMLNLSCFLHVLESGGRIMGPMNIEVDFEAELTDGRKLARSIYLSGPNAASANAAYEIASELDTLLNNRFERVEVARVNIDARVSPVMQMSMVDSIASNRTRLEPGETFKGRVKLVRWREDVREFDISLPIPENLRPGTYEVAIVDGPTRMSLQTVFNPQYQELDSLDEYLEMRGPDYPPNSLYVLLLDPSEQTVVSGMKMDNLPSSVAATTQSTARSDRQLGKTPSRLVSERAHHFDSMVVGSKRVPIEVVENRRATRPQPIFPEGMFYR